jgi:hypothetical protein
MNIIISLSLFYKYEYIIKLLRRTSNLVFKFQRLKFAVGLMNFFIVLMFLISKYI